MCRTLIIDHDPAPRKVLWEDPESNDEVIDTGDPESALAMTLKHKPGLILLDPTTPNLSAFELCQTIASLRFTRNISIIIVSGHDKESGRSNCQKLGAAEYFEKPISWILLRKASRRVGCELGHSPATRAVFRRDCWKHGLAVYMGGAFETFRFHGVSQK